MKLAPNMKYCALFCPLLPPPQITKLTDNFGHRLPLWATFFMEPFWNVTCLTPFEG